MALVSRVRHEAKLPDEGELRRVGDGREGTEERSHLREVLTVLHLRLHHRLHQVFVHLQWLLILQT